MRLDVSGCQRFKVTEENTVSQEGFENGAEICLFRPGFLNFCFNLSTF
jgi:hypothetical protein